MRVAELALRGRLRELSDLEVEGISARSAAPQSHNFLAIAAACAVNMSTLGELPSEASRSVHRAHVSLDCGMRSAPLPPIPSLVETSASTPYTPRTAHRHDDVRASVEQLVGLAGEQSRARQTVANRRGSVMGAHRVTQLAGVPRAAQRSVDLAGVGKAVMGAHRVTQLAGVPRAAQRTVDSGQLVSANHRSAIWRRLVLWFWVAPTVVAVWYSAALFFPDTARHYASAFLWTDGAIATNATSHITEFQCPKPALCATVGAERISCRSAPITAISMLR